MKATIKVYVPACSKWFTAAKLDFIAMPKMFDVMVDSIVDAYCEETMSNVSRAEVIVNRKIYKRIEY